MVDPASMLQGRTRETKIARDALGRWFNDGDEITHVLLRRAFDEWLQRAPDGSGRWCLSNDINWAFVQLEGPPRFVRSIEEKAGQLLLLLSDGARVELDPSTLRQAADGSLYCDVPGDLVARFDTSAVMQLSEHLGEDEAGVYLELGGVRHRPPTVDDPMREG